MKPDALPPERKDEPIGKVLANRIDREELRELAGAVDGISAGAYLGLKTTENKTNPVGPASTAASLTTDTIISNISLEVRSLLTQDKVGTL